MPRPKAAEKRDRQVNVALTEREFNRLKESAAAVGLRVADYARAALLRRRVAIEAGRKVPPVDHLTLQAIHRVGVNLNQACRQFNAFGHVVPPELEPLLRDIRTLVARIIGNGA